MNNDIARKCFAKLIQDGFLPANGNFDITEDLMERFTELYHHFANIEYKLYTLLYRRDAGKSFVNLKLERGISTKDIKEGFVYLIANPAWPDFMKVGLSVNVNKRLATYQTGDPHRAYTIHGYEFVINRRQTENNVISKFHIDAVQGEWVKKSEIKPMIKYIREDISFTDKFLFHRDMHNKKVAIDSNVIFFLHDHGYRKGKVTSLTKGSVSVKSSDKLFVNLLPSRMATVPNLRLSRKEMKNILTA